uniref:Uncharacterized protein n=1 Tax=Aegilops tauschii subsp. strangulata TaxID=200361 RepID=A0A453M1E5_AEGTS
MTCRDADAADLLHTLSLDPKGVAGQGKDAQRKVSAAPNGRLNGVVASPNPQVASAGQWPAMGQQDYKNANMYGAGADAYQYYYGGWGDYSVYVGLDGAESLNPVSVISSTLHTLQTLGLPASIGW